MFMSPHVIQGPLLELSLPPTAKRQHQANAQLKTVCMCDCDRLKHPGNRGVKSQIATELIVSHCLLCSTTVVLAYLLTNCCVLSVSLLMLDDLAKYSPCFVRRLLQLCEPESVMANQCWFSARCFRDAWMAQRTSIDPGNTTKLDLGMWLVNIGLVSPVLLSILKKADVTTK